MLQDISKIMWICMPLFLNRLVNYNLRKNIKIQLCMQQSNNLLLNLLN
jgi:hypothetical protein